MTQINQLPAYRWAVRVANRFFPEAMAKMRFKKYFGRPMNLENPQDINEKISWLALYSDISEWTRLADKYAVRQFVEERGQGDTLVKLYGMWTDARDIKWEELPESFMLKTNNGSGTVMLVKDKSKLNIPETVKLLNKWKNKDMGAETTEFHYKDIKPCIIAEEVLIPSEEEQKFSSTIIDYKVWCFNGEPNYVWACSNRVGDSTEVALFDTKWNYLPELSIFNDHYREQKHLVPKPKNLDEMIRVARDLAQGFPVVRVDLYYVNDKVYFGEMTFTSLGGTMNFYTDECLLSMGKRIDISNIKKVRNV